MKPKKSITLAIVLGIFGTLSLHAQNWSQLGTDMLGAAAGDQLGHSVSMPDAQTLAVGSIHNDDNGNDAGQVKIFKWNGSAWTQKGANINGKFPNDFFGFSISMPDSNTIAIGAPNNLNVPSHESQVRIYRWDGNTWVQKGVDINCGEPYDQSGYAVCMPDSNTVAIGANFNSNGGYLSGQASVYVWTGNAWIQKGSNIVGEAVSDFLGTSVCMPDSNTIAVGAPENDDAGTDAGNVKIFRWNGSNWTQKGLTILGENIHDESGYSISMPDSNSIAIGAYLCNSAYSNAGQVRIFSWDGNAWVQKGMDLIGIDSNEYFGCSVSMCNADNLVVGAFGNKGKARAYSWNGTLWNQVGTDIIGDSLNDYLGYTVCMPDSNSIAVGAPQSDENLLDAGVARVYNLTSNLGITDIANQSLHIYPNPVNAQLIIESNENIEQIRIVNSSGKCIYEKGIYAPKAIVNTVDYSAGMYVISIRYENQTIDFSNKLIIEK